MIPFLGIWRWIFHGRCANHRHLKNRKARGLQNPLNILKSQYIFFNMLEDVRCDYDIKTGIGEGEFS